MPPGLRPARSELGGSAVAELVLALDVAQAALEVGVVGLLREVRFDVASRARPEARFEPLSEPGQQRLECFTAQGAGARFDGAAVDAQILAGGMEVPVSFVKRIVGSHDASSFLRLVHRTQVNIGTCTIVFKS